MSSPILEKLRQIMLKAGEAGMSRYAISKATGISEAHLSRFVNGFAETGVENAEKMARQLGYELVLQRTKKKAGK